MMTAILDAAAEALRQYDRGGWKLNPWSIISAAQKEGWRTKAAVVLAAMLDAAERDPAVIEAMGTAECDMKNGVDDGLAALRALKAYVLGEEQD